MIRATMVVLFLARAANGYAQEAKPSPPPLYSLPWQLRPVAAATCLRSDTNVATFDKDPDSGATVASTLLFSYRVTPHFAPLIRLGAVTNWPLKGDAQGSIVNPVIGALYGLQFKQVLRLGIFVGAALPFGQGGGNTPNAAIQAATKAGVYARAAMDNAMFAVNYFTLFPGVGFAYVDHGLTVQAEVTLLELIRVRGEAVDKDSSRTNMTMGLHVGYFVTRQLSLGAEVRYQVWLSTPQMVTADSSARGQVSVGMGLRGHFKLPGTAWFRPGLAYTRGLDNPMARTDYNIVQVDLPVLF